MLYHVREANLLLRQQDFNRDGQPDCVGVHVTGLGILTSQHSNYNLLPDNVTTSEAYLRAFSKYQFDQHCLAVLFSSQVFSGKVLGLSWKGDRTKAGGICQTRVNLATEESPDMVNLNSLFITLSTRQTRRIPLRMGVLNLVHEMLHSFGASHDPRYCTPENIRQGGRFLMSKYSSSGVKSNNERISDCTAAAVTNTLANQESIKCLTEILNSGFCGDGVIQSEEHCDCGSVEECLEQRSACTPPGLWSNDRQCQWRRPHHGGDRSPCSTLGLDTCPCPNHHSNSVITCDQSVYCQRRHDQCLPVIHWASRVFQV